MQRVAVVCIVLASSASAVAAPQSWKLESDLDGSGKPAVIELDDHGALHVQDKTGTATLQVATSVTRATLHALRVAGVPTIVIDAETNTGEDGIVVERAASWQVVQHVTLVGSDLDREYTNELEAEPDGIYLYQARAGYHRCDGKPAYLFAQRYTHADGKFQRLSPVPTNIDAGAPSVNATPDPATAPRPIVYHAQIASHQAGARDAGELGIPSELDDGDPHTAWREDGQQKAASGQFFTFETRIAGAKASQLRIVPGGPTPAQAGRRPKRIAVVWAAGAVHVDIPDTSSWTPGTAYVVNLPTPATGCVSVVLEDNYGSSADATAISELEVFADGERTGGGDALLAAAVASGGDDVQRASQELARRGGAGVAALDAELAKAKDASSRARLVRALVASRDPTAAPVLARAIADHQLTGADLRGAITALGVLGEVVSLRQLADDTKLGIDDRIAAAHALASKPEAALELVGRGPRALRHAVIEVLTGLDADHLLATARLQTQSAAAGDLYRAATRRAHSQPSERASTLAAMLAALPSAADYERRYRLLAAVAALGDRAALDGLPALLAALPVADRPALSQVVAHALAEDPRADALPLALALTRDADPGVRLAALGALTALGTVAAASNADTAASDHAIEGALTSDTWPEVRRRAAQVLGDRCSRADPATALVTAFGRDPELDVKRDALTGLVECHAAGVAALLAHTWDDPKAPLALRQHAVDQAVPLADRELALQLVGKFAAWRGAALNNANALALAQSAAYAIGLLAPPGALEALEAGLTDEAFPEIVSASATGLGLLGPACTAGAREKLKRLAHHEEQQISAAAARAEALCGK
jgi:hypothetical protein